MDKFFEIGMLILGSIYALSHLLRTIYLSKDDDDVEEEEERTPPMSEAAKRMYS